MPKVLIIGPNFHYFNQSVADAYTELGWSTVVEAFDTPIHPFKGFVKWRNKFGINKHKLHTEQKKKYNRYIQERFDAEKPDFVFILNGDILATEKLDYFCQKSTVALWLFDSITNISAAQEHIKHVHYCFCYEQEDVDFYTKRGDKAYFLPQAYSPKLYFSESNTNKDIDVLFIGNVYISERRKEIISSIIETFPNKKIVVYGLHKPWYKNPIKWLFREHRNIYKNKNIPYNEVNHFYNRSKVVINVHHEQQRNGANPKVFEISGAGAYQVCDNNKYIQSLFPNGEIGLYANEQELIEQIKLALQQDNQIKVQEAQKTVAKQHTFTHRMQAVIDICFKNNA